MESIAIKPTEATDSDDFEIPLRRLRQPATINLFKLGVLEEAGLLIVRRCVDLHGGDVQCTSVEGAGTTFTVRLPMLPSLCQP